jgi:hypothetical protein
VVGFAAGALAGFTVIGLLVPRTVLATEEVHSSTGRTLAGVLHWFAIGAAVGAVALIAEIPSWVAWRLGMFAATTYLLGASLQLAVLSARSGREAERNERAPPRVADAGSSSPGEAGFRQPGLALILDPEGVDL